MDDLYMRASHAICERFGFDERECDIIDILLKYFPGYSLARIPDIIMPEVVYPPDEGGEWIDDVQLL